MWALAGDSACSNTNTHSNSNLENYKNGNQLNK